MQVRHHLRNFSNIIRYTRGYSQITYSRVGFCVALPLTGGQCETPWEVGRATGTATHTFFIRVPERTLLMKKSILGEADGRLHTMMWILKFLFGYSPTSTLVSVLLIIGLLILLAILVIGIIMLARKLTNGGNRINSHSQVKRINTNRRRVKTRHRRWI